MHSENFMDVWYETLWACLWLCGCMYIGAHAWRRRRILSAIYLSSPSSPEKGPLRELNLSVSARLSGPAPRIFTLWCGVISNHTTASFFDVGAWDLNSGPHACKAEAFNLLSRLPPSSYFQFLGIPGNRKTFPTFRGEERFLHRFQHY